MGKILDNLYNRAKKNARRNSNNIGSARHRRERCNVYEVVVDSNDNTESLYHYETLILKTKNKIIQYALLTSNSDRDAIGDCTFEQNFDGPRFHFYKSKMAIGERILKRGCYQLDAKELASNIRHNVETTLSQKKIDRANPKFRGMNKVDLRMYLYNIYKSQEEILYKKRI